MSAPAASTRTPADHRAEELRVWLALLVVYAVWGSTYLAIRIVVADLPPLMSAGLRFLVAGSVVAVAVAIRSGPGRLRVERRRLAAVALVGALLLLGGNGLVVLAEQTVPSALTALIIASTPIWVVVLRTITGDRVARGTLLGVAVGFVGVGVLVVPAGLSGNVVPLGLGMLILASICWATGSFVSSRLPLPADPFVSTSYQMLAGGALMLVAGTLRGEPFAPATWVETPDALLALGYLVVFGSLAAFSAYTWLLQHAPISRVATYAYVNPVVAVVLGAVILSESITPAMLVGGAVIVTGVALIIRHEAGVRRAREEAAAAAASSQSIEDEAETVPAGQASGVHPASALRFVALGDSYTIGTAVGEAERWPNQLVAHLGPEPPALELVANVAVNGRTSGDVVRDQLPALDGLRPDFVSLLIGVNDVVQGVPAERYRANVATILDALHLRLPADRILTVSTPDYTVTPAGADYGDPARQSAAIRAFNAILAEEAGARGIAHVDIHDLSLRARDQRSLVAMDGLHPSGAQYALWVERIAPLVAGLLGRPPLIRA